MLAEMTRWLNQMTMEEKNEKVITALLMTYFPMMRADAGAEVEELQKCYWELEQWFYRHRFVVRRRLNLPEEFHWERDLTAKATGLATGGESDTAPNLAKEVNQATPANQGKNISKKAKQVDALFGNLG